MALQFATAAKQKHPCTSLEWNEVIPLADSPMTHYRGYSHCKTVQITSYSGTKKKSRQHRHRQRMLLREPGSVGFESLQSLMFSLDEVTTHLENDTVLKAHSMN